jgi:plastocyanin
MEYDQNENGQTDISEVRTGINDFDAGELPIQDVRTLINYWSNGTTFPVADDVDTTIKVGPEGSLQFDPATATISKGDTVEWVFESGGHNVSGHPDAHNEVSIPDGATPFASYDTSGDDINHVALSESGTTYQHTFSTSGEYTYVCVPHAAAGMIGTITVQ